MQIIYVYEIIGFQELIPRLLRINTMTEEFG